MRSVYSVLIAIASIFFVFSCSSHKKDAVYTDEYGRTVLNTPPLPTSIKDSLEAANYNVRHYWDYMDFTIDSLTSSREFMERTIKGYLDLFMLADSSVIRESVSKVLARAQADTLAYSFMMNVPEQYLIDENSSRQEDYLYFADAFIASDFLSDVDKEVPRFYREVVTMNRVGTLATDIPYETLTGDSARLSDLRGVPTILYVYNTDCSMCFSEAAHLDRSNRLRDILRDGRLQILALSKTGPVDRWRDRIKSMPEGWIHGSAMVELSDLSLYAIFHVPTIYLIDAKGQVVLKDVSVGDLLLWLEENELPADPRPTFVN